MKSNPFKYGELSKGENFCNRTREITRLHHAFRDGQSIVIISPRRWGKSSLVEQALNTFKAKVISIRLDCFGFKSATEFYTAFLKASLLATNTKTQQLAATVKENMKGLIPYISYSIGEADEVKISLELPENKLDPVAILELPQKIAARRRIRILVCIDEFQQIKAWKDGDRVLEILRKIWQKHHDVCYCLYGSKRHLMTQLFSDKSQPFYNFGETIFLQKIERSEWVKFLLSEFKHTGKRIDEKVAVRLTELVGAHSYFLQYLARICWNNSQGAVTMKVLDASYEEMLNDNLAIFQNVTNRLTQYQTNYLRAIVAGESQLASSRVLRDYNLGSPGNIQRIAAVMEDLEILEYSAGPPAFCDPYFKPLFIRYFGGDD